MNIPRYILPVSFAAALHAALLFGWLSEDYAPRVVLVEVPLPPWLKPEEAVVTPPPEKSDTEKPVKPIAGGPTPPELDPPPAAPKSTDLMPPEDIRPKNPSRDIKIIPLIPGLVDIGGPETGKRTLPGIPLVSQLDGTPRAKVQPSPDYPARLRQDGISGSVTVEFEVNTTGQVVRAEATRYTHREFVEPALRAVRHWQFEPGRRDGRVVPFRMAVPIEFGLERS